MPPSKTADCVKTEDSSGNDLWTLHCNDRDFNWCARCNRWTTTHSTSTHKNKGSNPDRTYLAAAGASVSLDDWPCAFPCMLGDDSRFITTGLFPNLWDILGSHLPASFLMSVFFNGLWVSLAPALWLVVGFFVGFGPGCYFDRAYWPRHHRRTYRRRYGVSLPNSRDVALRFSRLLNRFLRKSAATDPQPKPPRTHRRGRKLNPYSA